MRRAALALLLAFPLSTLAAQATNPPAQETPASLTASYAQALQARDWASAIAAAQKLVDLSATADHLRMLEEAQINANALDAALATCDRAIAAAQQEKPAADQPDTAWKALLGRLYTDKGNAYLKLRRNPDAIAMYTQAASIDPNPATAYWNLCVTLYNTGDTDNGVNACRKSAQIDPSHADTWFILGSILYAQSTTMQGGKFVIPAESKQALEKYLELAPNGAHANDVKQMLDMAAD